MNGFAARAGTAIATIAIAIATNSDFFIVCTTPLVVFFFMVRRLNTIQSAGSLIEVSTFPSLLLSFARRDFPAFSLRSPIMTWGSCTSFLSRPGSARSLKRYGVLIVKVPAAPIQNIIAADYGRSLIDNSDFVKDLFRFLPYFGNQ